MGIFTGIDISASALVAERLRAEVVSNNMANYQSLREDGQRLQPYRRRTALFYTGAPDLTGSEQLGVRFAGVHYKSGFIARQSPDPENDPDAVRPEDARGNPALAPYVGMNLFPDVNPVTEMTEMILATQAYQANVTALQLTKTMLQSTLQVLA